MFEAEGCMTSSSMIAEEASDASLNALHKTTDGNKMADRKLDMKILCDRIADATLDVHLFNQMILKDCMFMVKTDNYDPL